MTAFQQLARLARTLQLRHKLMIEAAFSALVASRASRYFIWTPSSNSALQPGHRQRIRRPPQFTGLRVKIKTLKTLWKD